jgi:hypothetical protein
MAVVWKLSTNKNYTGSTIWPKGTNVNVRRLDKNNSPIMDASGIIFQGSAPGAFGVATGRQITPTPATDANGKRIEGWMEVKNALGFTGFVRFDLMTKVQPVTTIKEGDGKALLQNIISRDFSTYHQILVNEELISRLKKKGIATASFELQNNSIKTRYLARRKKIEDSKMLRFQTGVRKGFEWLKDKLGISAIGEPVTFTITVGGAIIAASIVLLVGAAIAYKMFHTDATAAEVDLKSAETLNKLIEAAKPEEAKKLKAEIQTLANKAYQDGYTKGSTDSVVPNVTEGVKSVTNFGWVALASVLAFKLF